MATLLHRLVYAAFIEIRAAAREGDTQRVFHLSDLFHTVPLRLDRIERGEVSPDDVIQWLRARAQEKGLAQWLEGRIQEESQIQTHGNATT